MRYKILLSYNGDGFCGWQKQNNSPSTQNALENALSILLNEEINVTGAGRTDTGVHSTYYTVHFDTKSISPYNTTQLSYKLNAILPNQIKIHEIIETKNDFHARFDANLREYKYFVHRSKDPFINNRSYLCHYNIDINKMNEAAKILIGTHDFSCFEKSGGNSNTPICTIYKAEWSTYKPDHVRMLNFPCKEDDYLVFTIQGNRFLRNMVRAIVGTLIDIGRGKKTLESMKEIIDSHSRCQAGESVPGHALFLSYVDYPKTMQNNTLDSQEE